MLIHLSSLLLIVQVRGQELPGPPLFNPHNVPEWFYWGPRGQEHWCCGDFGLCCGRQQSPMNVKIRHAQYAKGEACLSLHNYELAPRTLALHNDGHFPEVVYNACNSTSVPHVMIGSWRNGSGIRYELDRILFHFGNTSDRGSDHSLDDVHMPMEMQLIHRNTKYSSVSEAMNKTDGLLIVAIFFVVVPDDNPRLRGLVYNLKHVTWKEEWRCVLPFPLLHLLPPSYGYYYTYHGSLPFPPCFESVTWVVFHNPADVSEFQLNEFRRLQYETRLNCPDHSCPLYNNFRSPVCVENRKINWKEECAPDPRY